MLDITKLNPKEQADYLNALRNDRPVLYRDLTTGSHPVEIPLVALNILRNRYGGNIQHAIQSTGFKEADKEVASKLGVSRLSTYFIVDVHDLGYSIYFNTLANLLKVYLIAQKYLVTTALYFTHHKLIMNKKLFNELIKIDSFCDFVFMNNGKDIDAFVTKHGLGGTVTSGTIGIAPPNEDTIPEKPRRLGLADLYNDTPLQEGYSI